MLGGSAELLASMCCVYDVFLSSRRVPLCALSEMDKTRIIFVIVVRCIPLFARLSSDVLLYKESV